jgi:ABC-type iron transport system FetAB ATPase subunit
MSIINSQKFKHRKRVATEAQSMSLLTETSTKSIIQPYEAKKKPYRYLQIDTIKEFGASKSHSKSLSRNYHPSS